MRLPQPIFAFALAIAIPALSARVPQTTELADHGPYALKAQTDRLLFNTSLPVFITARTAALASLNEPSASSHPSPLDWNSDGCSSSPDHPFDFNFLPACQRHDFGYRNYHKQNRWSEENREQIDNNLYKDLLGESGCGKEEGSGSKKWCGKVAKLYWKAVRKFGKNHAAVRGFVDEGMTEVRGEMRMEMAERDGSMDEKLE